MGKKNGMANSGRLNPFDSDDKQLLRVVIETPKGSRNKFAYDPDEHIYQLKKVLPAGMTFPYDFGFVGYSRLRFALNSILGISRIRNCFPGEIPRKALQGPR